MSYTNYYKSSSLMHGSMKSMHTVFDALLTGDEDTTSRLWENMENELRRLEIILSKHDSDSELHRVNESLAYAPMELSDELWEAMTDARRYYMATEGLFDVTMGRFDSLVFDEANKTVYSLSDSTQIDLGGYGKGYALGKLKKLVEESGVKNAFINFGNSSVMGIGKHPYGEYWPAGIENPYTKTLLEQLKLADKALSVSGDSPRHEKHIIDPRTGLPANGSVLAAVVSDNPTEAEVLSTTMIVASGKERDRIAERFKTTSNIHIYNT